MLQLALAKKLFKLAQFAERGATFVQGKGYGTASIKKNELVHKLLRKTPDIAIDIGGNIGEYTAELRIRNPNMEIHVFEPSKINIQKLNVRFQADKLIKVLPYAVSGKDGTATLYTNEPGSGLGSLVQRKLDHFNIDFNIIETINTICFEDYWRNSLKEIEIDIVKIDIEGHELMTLMGFGRALTAIRVIQFEFGGCNIDTRTYFQDFWYFFKKHDFDIYRITPFGLEQIKQYKESHEYFSTTNYIAVNKLKYHDYFFN